MTVRLLYSSYPRLVFHHEREVKGRKYTKAQENGLGWQNLLD